MAYSLLSVAYIIQAYFVESIAYMFILGTGMSVCNAFSTVVVNSIIVALVKVKNDKVVQPVVKEDYTESRQYFILICK